MGAGRKTKTFIAPHEDLATYSASMRNLGKNHLGGVVFGCTKTTMEECLSKQLFGLPGAHFSYVKNITPGLLLFLFNFSDRKLHGIFEAASCGQMNINPYGWTTDGSEKTQFPAQVQIRVRLQCRPVLESQFKPILVDNYYSQCHFWFELDHAQTSRVMSLFATAGIASSTSVGSLPRNKIKWSDTFQARTSTGTLEWFKPLTSDDSTKLVERNDPFNAQIEMMEAEQSEEQLIFMKLKELALQSNLKSSEGEDISLPRVAEDHHVLNELTLDDNENPTEPSGLEEKRGGNPHSSSEEQKVESPQFSSEEKRGESPQSLSEQRSGESPQSLSEFQAIITKLNQEMEELRAYKTEFTEQSKKFGYLEHKLEQAETEIRCLKFGLQLESGSTPSKAHTDEKDTESCNVLHYDPNDSMYLVGGYDGESCLSAFDAYYPSQDMIKPLRPMSSVRSYASVAQLNGDLYVIGGGNGHVWYDTVESYSPGTDEWKQCPSLREKKGSLAAATTNSKIFAVGGGNGVDCFSDVEMLDLDVGRWIRTQSMSQKRMGLAAVELNGVLYATGGFDGTSYLNSVDRFDPREHKWTKIASMHSKRGCHSLVVLNEKIYALGGFDGDSIIQSVESFDPRLGSWMPAEPMYNSRGYSTAAVVKDTIYVIGGMKADECIAETVEYYKEGQGWQEMAMTAFGKRCFMSAVAYST
ncbi:uncharacterized protein LOC103962148 [Pyrus x bretschneideri]|uniref:uncharacterized protein LOC103962148 n=1 Tax=Pyrus x bretschneideri TaxID=225117 RepID=UPI0005119BD3|nr:uncharacterized protein LOC103962148 [Pyrus x bretschneideri]XP_009373093.1 uncharacterized protein LOC103962148 [Pyrus x bretschneideri]XP_009373095.1 uncharacterized protein LOC103962148 [Pyrus x bretschneideri]